MNKPTFSPRSRLQLIELAQELGSIAAACRAMGVSRDSYYRYKKQHDAKGDRVGGGLPSKKPKGRPRIPEEAKNAILDIARRHPHFGRQIVSKVLFKNGFKVSPSTVRLVWLDHGIETPPKRLKTWKSVQGRTPQKVEFQINFTSEK